jgi:AraC-like DNA-binding protein
MLKLEQKQKAWQGAHATRADFCRIFQAEMKPLYLLAFLLTADHAKAERCFLAALADAGNETAVFCEFATTWSRRAIIINAIRLTAPASTQANKTGDLWNGTEDDLVATRVINGLTQLSALERFAFVLSVLEGYRDSECVLLMGSARGEVTQARMRALQKLATVASMPQKVNLVRPSIRARPEGQAATRPSLSENTRCKIAEHLSGEDHPRRSRDESDGSEIPCWPACTAGLGFVKDNFHCGLKLSTRVIYPRLKVASPQQYRLEYVEGPGREPAVPFVRPVDSTIMTVPDDVVARWRQTLRHPHALEARRRDEAVRSELWNESRPQRMHPRVRRVLFYLHQQELAWPATSLTRLAQVADLSPSRLMHTFTESLGIPLRPYLLWLRVHRAAGALAAGHTITEAAHLADFADAPHLTRTFRRMFGVTPRELIRRGPLADDLRPSSSSDRRLSCV